ncbi:MAG: AAA family ATPase, partial [Mollicutes bacterium]|nr:AAA family ATPase [Mollicutes bacterium]
SLNAVIISPDEATYELINNEQGEFYNVFSERLNKYLTRKVGEIAKAGANVIFERGLWSSKDRKEIKEYYKNNGVDCEIHYVCVDDDTWKQNIAERNQRVLDGNGGSDFYLDEGLMKKLESKWEEPTEIPSIWRDTLFIRALCHLIYVLGTQIGTHFNLVCRLCLQFHSFDF